MPRRLLLTYKEESTGNYSGSRSSSISIFTSCGSGLSTISTISPCQYHRGAEGREAGVKKRGGKRPDRVKEDSVVDTWWHPDAKDALTAVLKLSERRYKAGKFEFLCFSVI